MSAHDFAPNLRRYKGGSGASQEAPVVTPPPTPTAAPTPTPLPTPAPAAPPATLASPTITAVQQDTKRASAKKKGINSTILGQSAPAAKPVLGNSTATATLLGGG